MKTTGIIFLVIGIIVIIAPEIIAYVFGTLFIVIGTIMLLGAFKVGKSSKKSTKNYVEFGGYKIYR